MAHRDNPEKSNRAAQQALEAARRNPAISDFRKESKCFALVAGGGFTLDQTEVLCAALLSDLACGFHTREDIDAYVKPVAVAIANKKVAIQAKLLDLQAD